MSPQVLENLGMPAKADGLCKADIARIWWFSVDVLLLYCVVITSGTLRNLHREVNFFFVNYSYCVTFLEETKMQCFSETVIQIWGFECETVLLNSGFARSCKISRFVNIWLLS